MKAGEVTADADGAPVFFCSLLVETSSLADDALTCLQSMPFQLWVRRTASDRSQPLPSNPYILAIGISLRSSLWFGWNMPTGTLRRPNHPNHE